MLNEEGAAGEGEGNGRFWLKVLQDHVDELGGDHLEGALLLG